MKRVCYFIIIGCFYCLQSSMAQAAVFGVGKFSRACRFDQIPFGTKYIAAKFFVKMGANPEFGDLASKLGDEQAMYWVNEALTTDYFQVRYFLFAKANVYATGPYGNADPNLYNLRFSYASKWSVEEVKKAIQSDPLFAPSYANRGPAPWYSARAGESGILQRWYLTNFPNTPAPLNTILVVGRHFYYDPVNKSTVDLGETRAKDCNLTNLGFGIFDR